MENIRDPEPDLIYFNGIDTDTGAYATPPIPIADLAKRVESLSNDSLGAVWTDEETRGIAGLLGTDLEYLDQAGWGIIFHENASEAVRAALAPLIDRRRQQAGSRFQILDYRQGEQVREWYQRHGVWAGNVDPERVPFYLLLVGPPTEIPFDFQYLLSIEYAVGRLAFQQSEDYACYARSVIAYEESAAVDTSKEIVYWSTRHPGDPATTLSNSLLVRPLAYGADSVAGALKQPVHTAVGYGQRVYEGGEATKGALLGVLAAERPPALLFTASHGMIYHPGQPKQRTDQGGLLCQDWPGHGRVRAEHYLAAGDIPESARVHGMVAFLFACCGAGTPTKDQFLRDLATPDQAPMLAPQPFVAALPQRLLSHPRGAALAVVGHVDRAYSFSIRPSKATGAQILPFRSSLGFILGGTRVGMALMMQFGQRFAALSAQLLSSVSPSAAEGTRLSGVDLVQCWMERNDAQNYVLLGDPAVRIRTETMG